jgi:hypothetical protein
LIWQIPYLPPAGTITEFGCLLEASAHGSLPAGMPQLGLFKQHIETANVVSVGSITDSASISVYSDPHIVSTAASETIDPAYIYYLRLYGEIGTNSQTGLSIYSSFVKISN